MTPKEKAVSITGNIFNNVEQLPYSLCKQIAQIAVDEIETALYEYGQETNELQNMDSEFRFWAKVKKEIEQL